ncbi:Glutamyl-tRNA(Gln) amidotransferase subunit C, chloroplastic/mitochondrial [subsurface metagenome]
MTSKISNSEVRKVAKLSRLELTDDEIKEFTGQLSAILYYVEKMNELDTENIEPLAHSLPITNVFREDSVKALRIYVFTGKLQAQSHIYSKNTIYREKSTLDT